MTKATRLLTTKEKRKRHRARIAEKKRKARCPCLLRSKLEMKDVMRAKPTISAPYWALYDRKS
jgi:hypothetical protein